MACRQEAEVEKVITIQHYASGSGTVFHRDILYLIGDDMSYVLMLDANLNIVDSFPLADLQQKRIAKEKKQDLEAATVVRINRTPFLMFFGSGSLDPYRNSAWLINLRTGEKTEFNLIEWYQRLAQQGIAEVNIEGATWIPGGLLLSNRGNKSFPKNHLILTTTEFFRKQDRAKAKLIKVGGNEDTTSFSGVSGLEYSQRTDRLLLTVSTENTFSAQEDGSIGKSYLWIINNISSKKRMAALNPDRVFDLEALDRRFAGHKIESVSITSENREEMELVLVADNDQGNTVLFKMKLKI
jgi:hypothetical protein